MISKDTKLPYDKTKLTKSFKDVDYEDLLLRDRDWYKDNGVTYLLGREVMHVDNKHGGPYVVLEDGLKLVNIILYFIKCYLMDNLIK